MAREKHWTKVSPLLFLENGGSEGEITVVDTFGFYVKQVVILQSNTTQRVDLEIKRVLSKTEIKVGRKGYNIDDFVDLTSFTVIDDATIRADEQTRRNIPPEDIIQAKFAREPVNADRIISVDVLGELHSKINPAPVSVLNDLCLNDTDQTSSTEFIFIGQSRLDGDWLIKRFKKSGTCDVEMRYATTKINPAINIYENAWDNRLNLTYTLKHGQLLEGNLLTELGDALLTEGGDNIVL